MAQIFSSDGTSSQNPLKKGWNKIVSLNRSSKATLAGLLLALILIPVLTHNSFDNRQHASELSSTSSQIPEPTLNPIREVNGKTITLPKAVLKKRGAPGTPGMHALGAIPDTVEKLKNAKKFTVIPIHLPNAVDLSASVVPGPYPDDVNNPPVGDQGWMGSCVAWAVGYFQRGWYAKRDNYYPVADSRGIESFSPTFIYNQINGGNDYGSSPFAAYDLLMTAGVDTHADFTPPGDLDYKTQPTNAQLSHALPYTITDWSYMNPGDIDSIKTAIASGNPVTITIPVYPSFDFPDSASCLAGTPAAGTSSRGNHQISGYAYDDRGLWIQNSWGTDWGCNGHIDLSWDYIKQYGSYSYVMTPSNANFTPTPTPPDTTGPVVSITQPPADGYIAKGATVTFEASATDRSGVAKVEFYMKVYGGKTSSLICTDTSVPYTCTWTAPKKGITTYVWTAKATDTIGNTSTSNLRMVYTPQH